MLGRLTRAHGGDKASGGALVFGNGKPAPQGCSEAQAGSLNFALVAPDTHAAWLLLLPPTGLKEWAGRGEEGILQQLDPVKNRLGPTWHVELKLNGVSAVGVRYAWLLDPPLGDDGRPIASAKRIVDPCARSLDSLPASDWNVRASKKYAPMAVVPDFRTLKDFDWQGVQSPRRHLKDLVIYEAHVRGFTMNPDSGLTVEENKGTFAGFIEKIPHLLHLGVNCVELLPVFEFDETACPRKNPFNGEQLCNYWGYMTVAFYVPMQRFATKGRPSASIVAFKTLVRELHRHGIEVFLDVVFNHTAEGAWGEHNWHSLASVAKSRYYILSKGCDTNYTGCGNTVNANDPTCTDWIIDCLRYWALDCRVDGFRFDLASALTRGSNGQVMQEPPLMRRMAEDQDLKHVKLIAEPWDCSWPDGYLLGRFPSCCRPPRWAEWNGKFRDTVRCFLKGDQGFKGEFATRVSGSSDLFRHSGRLPFHSVNFVTAHDGFTLRDLVSYNGKHNERNNEESGDDHNNSWNCGHEGPTGDGGVNHLRERQMRNMLVALFLSIGTPMLVFGDEYGRSQQGCNNGWCQDAISWFSWSDCSKEESRLLRFTRLVIAFRKRYGHIFQRENFLNDKDIWWRVDWDDPYNYLCYVLHDHQSSAGYSGLLVAFNAGHEHRECDLPEGKAWYRIIDTNLASPKDFCEDEANATKINSQNYGMHPYSAIVLKCMQDKKSGAVAYNETDSKYQGSQQIAEHLQDVVTRSMSCELLPNIAPGMLRTASMMIRKSSMSGLPLPALEEDLEPTQIISRIQSMSLLAAPRESWTPEESALTIRSLSKSLLQCSFTRQASKEFGPQASKEFEPACLPEVQANEMVSVRFSVTCQSTNPGEAVFVVGSVPSLGSWNPAKAVLCTTGPSAFPVWSSDGVVSIPIDSEVEFKLIVATELGRDCIRWEDGENRRFKVSSAGSTSIATCTWGTPGVTVTSHAK